MTLEFCIDSFEGAQMALKHEAKRLELCSALSIGGLSPSMNLVRQCAELQAVEVHVMIRPAEGHFVYSKEQIACMKADIESAANAGASGLVFGCLNENNELNLEQNKHLIEEVKKRGLECTLHRAFDLHAQPLEAMEQAIELGFDRILTSGGKDKAIDGMAVIQQLVKAAKSRIEIMAGSGVNSENAAQLVSCGVDALHLTIHRISQDSMLGMGANFQLDEAKILALKKVLS